MITTTLRLGSPLPPLSVPEWLLLLEVLPLGKYPFLPWPQEEEEQQEEEDEEEGLL